MFACIVRKEDGSMASLLVPADERGDPILPPEWILVDALPWRTVESQAPYSLSCNTESTRGQRVSLR